VVDLRTLGFKSFDEFTKYFFNTLLPTNRTYDYYVNWNKILERLENYKYQLSLLNYLTHIPYSKRRDELKNIIIKYPEVREIIPFLIALRERDIEVLELVDHEINYRRLSFKGHVKSRDEAEEISDFCDKVGLLKAFDQVKDLYTYVFGVEVGIDSNARKNRSGKIFEDIVHYTLEEKFMELDIEGLKFVREDSSIRTVRNKRADFVIYYKNRPVTVIEVSFYTVSGSKPIETANAYINLNNKLRRRDMTFIWVTDGKAWLNMKRNLVNVFKEIDYPLNYTLLKNKFSAIIRYQISSL